MRIEFFLRYHTTFGQQLFITGNLFSLGRSIEKAALPMTYLNTEFWQASIEVDDSEGELSYQYILLNEKGERIKEGEKHRIVSLKTTHQSLILIDTWNYAGDPANIFYSAPFKNVFFKNQFPTKLKKAKEATHIFKVKAPLLEKDEVVCIAGSDTLLGKWNASDPILLEKKDDWFSVALDLSTAQFPVSYKFGLYNYKKKEFIAFEKGDNRILHSENKIDSLTIVHDGFFQIDRKWKGCGVAIPVFSLRSQSSFGVGEFADIKLLTDWAVQTGMKLIQFLPINDTSASFSELDSYPYAAISAFALHPLYINLQKVAGKKYAPAIKSLQKKQKQLNGLAEVDYVQVMHYKMSTLRELFALQGDEFTKEKEYTSFVDENHYWLRDYAVFCYLRDKNGSAEFSQWKLHSVYKAEEAEKLATGKTKAAKEILFYYFIQYHLHLQLSEAVSYAHKKGIALKGDLPIGIARNSVDAWVAPHLYHMEWQAGAPPDDFAVKGQNWGFPTYNWEVMEQDGFNWWHKRFCQMQRYFDAFRIDHILGFFRIWSIPVHAVEGIMGRFVPALPLTATQISSKGIWFDYDRFCKPYITNEIIDKIFADKAEFVKEHFLQENSRHGFDLREEFNTQKKVEVYFSAQDDTDENQRIKNGLYHLIANVIFFDEEGLEGQAFHFRISMEQTSSFQDLNESIKLGLKELYIVYFYRMQDDFWEEQALEKLPYLKEATDMLVCGEDLGMVPHCVPGVMQDLGILSLEIQRMPKNPQTEFFQPKHAPYLSVITPSTHDMNTVRSWWEEDRARTQRFYSTELEGPGDAPYFCESWINRAIILQHLYSPAMWSIFTFQDLLGMSETLRRENPAEERINEPSNPKHYWRYRMHLSLEQLIKEKAFNQEMTDYITNSGR